MEATVDGVGRIVVPEPLRDALGPAPGSTVDLSRAGIAGGAVYDALVGLCASAHDVLLATRDARALGTYDAVGARSVVVGG